MDIDFQDRIDDYLLDRMSDADKKAFLQEVEQNEEKKEQLEFTKNVKDSICSREKKLQVLAQLQRHYEAAYGLAVAECSDCNCNRMAPAAPDEKKVSSKKRIWWWISGIAAVLVVGFFAIKPIFVEEISPDYIEKSLERVRGGDELIEYFEPTDSIENDTIAHDLREATDE